MKHVLFDASFMADYLGLSQSVVYRIHFDIEYIMYQNADHPEEDFESLVLWARGTP